MSRALRVRFPAAPTFVNAAAVLLLVLSACGGSDAEPTTEASPSEGERGKTGESSPPVAGGGGGGTPAPKADPAACSLPTIAGVAAVKPTFKVLDPEAGVAPPAMKGGSVDGKWKVDKATVYLPKEVKGLAKPDTSAGTLTSWAIFEGASYRLSIDVDFSIDSVIGPQPQTNSTKSQGTFGVKGPSLEFLTSCDPAGDAQGAKLTFSEDGARGTLVVEVPGERGTTFLELGATKEK